VPELRLFEMRLKAAPPYRSLERLRL